MQYFLPHILVINVLLFKSNMDIFFLNICKFIHTNVELNPSSLSLTEILKNCYTLWESITSSNEEGNKMLSHLGKQKQLRQNITFMSNVFKN